MRRRVPFALSSLFAAAWGRRQGSAMNSLRSALTAAPSGRLILRSRRRETLRGLTVMRKSVYHVPGTMCIPCIGLDTLSPATSHLRPNSLRLNVFHFDQGCSTTGSPEGVRLRILHSFSRTASKNEPDAIGQTSRKKLEGRK